MELRPPQAKAVDMITESIKQGLKRPIVAAPTAFGKTVLAAHLMKRCQDKGRTGYFFCDRTKLVSQTVDKFKQFGIDFGVRQADHELSNPAASIQIASIQTVQAAVNKHRGRLPAFDFAIVDEAHNNWEIINQILHQYNNVPIIGLSATPYTKGLGLKYNNLLVPATQREMIELGYSCPVRYFGGEGVDVSAVRSANPNAFNAGDLEAAADSDRERVTGCVISNWLEYGEGSQTIAFSPSQQLSKSLVERFNDAGISAEHIDCYTPDEDRAAMYSAHDAGEFKVLSCSRLLNTGHDAPTLRCIIDCFPVKSLTTYVQRAGRLNRIHPGKQYGIYLDHAGNFDRFGGPADYFVPTQLDDSTTTHRETELATRPKKEAGPARDCPQCYQKLIGPRCACGWERPSNEILQDDGSMLKELVENTGKKANKSDSRETKSAFLAELKLYAASKGYKPGWASNQYREKYGVWPNKIDVVPASIVGEKTKGWIKHQAIKRRAAK